MKTHTKGFQMTFVSFLKMPTLIFMVLLIFASCRSSDDDDRDEPQNPLIGFWQPYRLTQTATLSTGPYSHSTEFSICQQRARMLFNEDGTGNAKTYAEENGVCGQQNNNNFTYTYDAKTNALVFTDADGTKHNSTVKTLTETDFVYESVGRYDFQGEPDVLVTSTISARKTKD